MLTRNLFPTLRSRLLSVNYFLIVWIKNEIRFELCVMMELIITVLFLPIRVVLISMFTYLRIINKRIVSTTQGHVHNEVVAERWMMSSAA